MISSGTKRGLAAAAVSAMAVAGLPFLASSASATTIDSQVGSVVLLSQGYNDSGARYANTISADNDGQNSTATLAAAAPASVTSILFQFSNDGTTWTDVNTVQGRNADGVFTTEWAIPASLQGATIQLRAVPNTGVANAATDASVKVDAATTHDAVELSTDGALGIYQNPQTLKDSVAVRGTVGKNFDQNSVGVRDLLRGNPNNGVIPIVTAADGSKSFSGVLAYPHTGVGAYPYSPDASANQLVLDAASSEGEDVDASTLYLQTITSVTATPKQTSVNTGATTPSTVTVTDQNGKPVAGATVGYLKANTAPAAPTDTANVGTTDANGQVTVPLGAGTYTFYADADATAGHSAGDKDAASFTVTEYAAAPAKIAISSDKGRTFFAPAELAGASNDFFATATDQNNNPISTPVEYRWTSHAYLGDATVVGAWTSAGSTDATTGKVTIPNPSPLVNSPAPVDYTLEVRHPNVGGTGLVEATPVTYMVIKPSITWAEGADANAPVNGTVTLKGNLGVSSSFGSLNFAGRTVELSYAPGADSSLAPQAQQPAGTTVTGANTATAVADADGNFSVTLVDPAVPSNVTPTPENGVLSATSTETGNTTAKNLNVHFAAAPVVSSIDVTAASTAKPGAPGAISVVVHGADADTNPANDPVLKDQDVTVSVDEGFLTDGKLAAGHNTAGDLYGYFNNEGQSVDLSTGDAGTAATKGAIERNEGFDDDGLVTQTVTVTSGGVTKTAEITFNSRNPINVSSFELVPGAGAPTGNVTVGKSVAFNLYQKDQFGNLAGDSEATVSDDTTDADLTTDGEYLRTLTDFSFSGANIVAKATAPTVQTVSAGINAVTTKVPSSGSTPVTGSEILTSSKTVTWVAAPPKPVDANLKVSGSGGDKDKVKANAISKAKGAKATLYKGDKKIASHALNGSGDYTFKVKDKNGKKTTKYTVKITSTKLTKSDSASAKIK